MSEAPENEQTSKSYLWIFLLSLVAVLAFWLVWPFFVYRYISGVWQERAAFGEIFGAASALFSGLAFAGLIYTLILQRQELKRTTASQNRTQEWIEKQSRFVAISGAIAAQSAKIQSDKSEQNLNKSIQRVLTLEKQLQRMLWEDRVPEGMKICPSCFYPVEKGVKACRHCLHDFDLAQPS